MGHSRTHIRAARSITSMHTHTHTLFSLPSRARSHPPKRGAALPQKRCDIPPKGMSRPPKRGGRPPQKGANQRSGQARAGRVTRGPGYCECSRSSPGHRVRWTRQTSIVRRVDLTHVLYEYIGEYFGVQRKRGSRRKRYATADDARSTCDRQEKGSRW